MRTFCTPPLREARPERGAERGAVIAGGGLDIDVVEEAGLQEAAVGGAVEGDAAGHGELAEAGLAAEVTADVEHDFVEAFLESGGDVTMIVGGVAVRDAGGDQVLFEVAAGGAVGFAVEALIVEAKDGNFDQAVVEELDGLLEKVTIAGGIAVGREAHDLVFVRVEVEAKVQCDDGIEDADRVLCGDFGELVDFVVVRVVSGDRVSFAHAIEDDDEGFVPAGGVVGAGGVGEMMIDVVDLVGGKAGKMLVHLAEQLFAREDLFVLLSGSGVEHESSFEGRVVEGMGEFVDVTGLEAGGFEAVVDRVYGEVTGVLFAAEAFFGGAGDDFAVDHEDGGGVVALGNAIFAFFETRPALFLKRDGVLESADAYYFRHGKTSSLRIRTQSRRVAA